MSLQPFTKEQLNYFKFSFIVNEEFPKALRQTFIRMWDTTYGHLPGYQVWDDSPVVRNMFLTAEGDRSRVPTNTSINEWALVNFFQATIFARSFALPDSIGHLTTLFDLYVRPRSLPRHSFHPSVISPNGTEQFALAIDQLRLLRNCHTHQLNGKLDKITFDQMVQQAKEAFIVLGVNTAFIDAIGSLPESDFPTAGVQQLEENIRTERQAGIHVWPRRDKAQQPYDTALEDASDPLSKPKALLLEESLLKRDRKTNILRGKVKEEGDFWELTEAAGFIRFPPKAVTEPMEITCPLWSPGACSPPLGENEALVSNVIELSCDGLSGLKLSGDFNEGITLGLSHSATDLEGYEVVIQQLMDSENNEWKDLETKNTWRASGIQGDPPLAEAKVTQCSSFAVVWRLKSFTFSSSTTSVTDPIFTCIVPEYPDASVAIPRSNLPESGDFSLTIKVQEVPCDEGKDDGVLVGPILHISSSPGVRFFKEPVTIKIPFTLREAKKEVIDLSSDGQLRILYFNCRAKYREWTEITDELETPADVKDGVVTFQVKHFSKYSPQLQRSNRKRKPSSSELSHFVKKPRMPQEAGFLACIRETGSSGTLMLTLFCYPLHMKHRVYSTVSSRSKVLGQVQKNGLEEMCKGDKAFISVMEKIKPLKDKHLEGFFLIFLGDDDFERDMLVSVEGEGVPKVELVVRQEEQQEGKLMCELFFSELQLLKIIECRQSPAGSFVTPTNLDKVRPDLHPLSEDVYKMTANPRGLVLIINNRTFDRKAKLSKRRGSEKDVESIQRLFEGLQFEVHKKLNRTGDEIIGLLRNFARMDHSQFDCFVVWLMSHGNENGIFGTDGEIVPIETARNFFSNASCKSLKGKPKLFFIQACRGRHIDEGVEVTDGPKRRPVKTLTVPAQSNRLDEACTIPDQCDFMTAYASVRKYVSYRHARKGSSYVRCLVKVFREHACYKHLLELLTLVIYQVGKIEHGSYRKLKQCPQQEPTLSKLLFFWPGL